MATAGPADRASAVTITIGMAPILGSRVTRVKQKSQARRGGVRSPG
jgi:hypothetical protein